MTEMHPEIVELVPKDAVAVRGDVGVAELPDFFARAFTEAAQAAAACGIAITGPPFGFYPEMPTATVAVEAGFPVAAAIQPSGEVHPFVLPGGRAVRVVHVGPYETMTQTYAALQSWMAEHHVRPGVGMWESYLSDPHAEPDPAHWRTEIVWPLAED